MAKIRVLLADDHPLVRSGIRGLLDQQPDIVVVGEAQDGHEVLQLVKELTPDVLLLDIEMPGITGLEVTRKLHADRSPVQVLALSAYADRQYALHVLANGAAGYLTKEEAPETIVAAVRGVYRGQEGWLSRRVAIQVVASAQEGRPEKQTLTEREMRTLRLAVSGKTNEQIGKALHLDEGTVESDLQAILPKLGGAPRVQAAMRAVHSELLEGLLTTIRILIVDDMRLMCHMMAAVLDEEPDVTVVGCATSVKEAQEQLEKCDMVLVNSGLPNNGALQLVRIISGVAPSVKALIVGVSEMEPAILQYIEAGAAGFIPKDDSTEALLQHIRAAHQDAALISPRIAAALMARVNELAEWVPEIKHDTTNLEALTSREREVLQMIAQGLSNKEIADRLFIEAGTVKNHVHNIYKKLNIDSRQNAVAYAALMQMNGQGHRDSQGRLEQSVPDLRSKL